MSKHGSLSTAFTKLLNIELPIIGAPMFLVSNVEMVVAVSEAGGIGTMPSLNFRPIEEFRNALVAIRKSTAKPFGVNIIVNKSNSRQHEDLRACLDAGVNLFITSLGNPKQVILDAHANGAKVICDVTNLEHAIKVQELGADGVIAVSQGAGGHAGPISPLVLIPWLKKSLAIPVIAAGGIADGYSMAAALILGADGVSVGTRFIASLEAKVDLSYKQAIVNSTAEDIVMTTRISGTPAAVINTPYIQKIGTELPWFLRLLLENRTTKKLITPLIHLMGMKQMEESTYQPTWKAVWSAGQSVGLINEILSCDEIIKRMVSEYKQAVQKLPVPK